MGASIAPLDTRSTRNCQYCARHHAHADVTAAGSVGSPPATHPHVARTATAIMPKRLEQVWQKHALAQICVFAMCAPAICTVNRLDWRCRADLACLHSVQSGLPHISANTRRAQQLTRRHVQNGNDGKPGTQLWLKPRHAARAELAAWPISH